MITEVRRILLNRLKADLIGPSYGTDEKIDDRPTDRYLTGILFPQNVSIAEEEDNELEEVQSKKADTEAGDGKNISIFRSSRPATAGMSFAVMSGTNAHPRIRIEISTGTYRLAEFADTAEENSDIEAPKNQDSGNSIVYRRMLTTAEDESKYRKQTEKWWQRIDNFCTREVVIDAVDKELDLGIARDDEESTISGLGLYIRQLQIGNGNQVAVTVQAINKNKHDSSMTINDLIERTFFQFELEIFTIAPSAFVPRPVTNISNDEDAKISALIYRNSIEYATGHTCSTDWKFGSNGLISSVRSTWMPEFLVRSVDPTGDSIFNKVREARGLGKITAAALAGANIDQLEKMLSALTDAYEQWLGREKMKIEGLSSADQKQQARKHLERCRTVLKRMKNGINLVVRDDGVRKAFQYANEAMSIQAAWGRGFRSGHPDSEESELEWYPFQLGFALMCIKSFHDPSHDDRRILDLIWFPTGGGKTEAYLLVASFVLFYRRFTAKDYYRGTAVLMRYTLRTLTIQQFQRAAAMICACELLRSESYSCNEALGDDRFSIGLWVGEGSTPNKSNIAIEIIKSLNINSESTPKQIEICPACHENLIWEPSQDDSHVICRCATEGCNLSNWEDLPIQTVDDQIYANPPSMLIGTVDKFAQLVRRVEVGNLFGRKAENHPPDLIIQDELHLISGPLGTLMGIYETVIDQLCVRDQIVAKVIGSTATIRRATQQVHALFQRQAFQFPPPAIDVENSGFAKIDDESPGPDDESRGRLYVGLTTAGRTDKYMLQAVCASLLQAVMDKRISESKRDPYGTLVAYFNSLRILGGALVAMQDDVAKSIHAIARRRSENPRVLAEPEELTSRIASSEIPKVLRRLNKPLAEPGSIDTLLASNMLSVGVDIPRLGLMVVNGQPKTMSEYIQSTSRVGRQRVPGLVVTIYNSSKPRDRGHYETFRTWHTSLYRSIEATSVTPFAPRARDKALHAALVGMARHLLHDFTNPELTQEKRIEIEEKIVPVILDRIRDIDERELSAAEQQIKRLLDEWEARGQINHYWWDQKFDQSLMVSAEKAATLKASVNIKTAAWETPNSMRNVEPSVNFKLWESANLQWKI